jgi:hypothetical protein
MNSTLSFHSTPNDCFFESDLAPNVDAFVDYLKQGRYAKTATLTYLGCIAHFARLASQSHLNIKQLDEMAVSQFLDDHLPNCECPVSVCRSYKDLRITCAHLLRILRDSGAIAEPAVATSPIEDELLRFDEYMRNVHGLAFKTRSARIRIVQHLLLERFTGRRVVIPALQPVDVRHFIANHLEQRGTISKASALASALRAYFRYRTVCGNQVHALIGVIALPAHWGLRLPCRDYSRLMRLIACLLHSPLICRRHDAATPWCAEHSIRDCVPAKSPSSVFPTSTGKPVRSGCAVPSRAGKISYRYPLPPDKRSQSTSSSNALPHQIQPWD